VACLNEVVAGELREFYVEGAAVVGGVSGCLWGGAVGHSSSLNGACGLTLFVFSGAEVSVGLVCPDMQSENGRNASGRKLLQPRGPYIYAKLVRRDPVRVCILSAPHHLNSLLISERQTM